MSMLRDLGLSAEQYGFVISAFSIAYMIGNPLWGHWLDRFGLRSGMTTAVVTWTVASVSHAFTGGFAGLAAARAALGFGEGATFPGALRTVVQTLPPASRSRGVALAYSGGSLGAVITPIIVTPIAVVWGWRAAFWLTGFVGLAWVSLWLIVSRRPDIRQSMTRADRPATERAPQWRDRRLWSFVCSYALGALPLGFVLYAAAIYLSQALGKTQLEIGKVLWIPPLGWEVGYFFWGYVTDRWLHAGQAPLTVYRRLFTVAVILSLPLALTARIEPYWLVLFELFFAMFVAAAFVIISISYVTAIYLSRES
jgi:ACS family hexuronate transporter-like MFS transporter